MYSSKKRVLCFQVNKPQAHLSFLPIIMHAHKKKVMLYQCSGGDVLLASYIISLTISEPFFSSLILSFLKLSLTVSHCNNNDQNEDEEKEVA